MNTAVFRFGEFTFDYTRRVLLRAGVEHHLSPKAQQLLYLLIEARPRVLSREDLYDAIWPSTFVCETNLAGIVNEIRRALQDDARAAQFIRTIHGYGYAFCGQLEATAAKTLDAAVLIIYRGRRHLLYDGENVVGRSPDCGVVVADPSVSRHHAVITLKNGALTIHDLGSKNGTYVDEHRIGNTPVPLKSHTRIHLGLVALDVQRRALSSTESLQLNMAALKHEVARHRANA